MAQVLDKLLIYPSIDTPKVDLNAETGILAMEGKSFPPDVIQFYSKITTWIDDYIENPFEKTVVNLKLDYFNTASSKIILDILYKFEELHHNGNKVIINWHYPEDDEDMEETGIEYSEIVDAPFKLISYTFVFE